jgi:drug/metabolite transporter (DMT)-like permease
VKRSPYPLLLTGVACVSTGAILVRLAQAPPLAVAFYRVALASLILVPLAAGPALRSWPGLSTRQRLALLGSGTALALHFATWIASLSYTSVASSVLLVNTAPLFTLVLSRLVLREPVRRGVVAAIGLALCGAALIAVEDWVGTPGSLRGNALAVCGALTLAVYQIAGRGLRGALPLPAYLLSVWGASAMALGGLCLATDTRLAGFDGRTLALFLALAVVPTLAGHGLINRSLRLLPAPTVGVFLLGEPVGASLMALALFGEAPGPAAGIGGLVILAALATVIASEKQ